MKCCLSLFMTMAFVSIFQCCGADEAKKQVEWLTNYEQAVNKAQATSKPMLLFFTGSDWCGWCNKLEEEVFDSPSFSEAVGDKFIFLKLDFPREKPIAPAIKEQNRQLRNQFDIRNYPTIIIFDAKNQRKIGTTGYRPGGGKQYSDHLMKFVNDYQGYMQQMHSMGSQPLSGSDLKKMYEKACELAFDNDVSQLVKMGLESDQKLYFQIERYRLLADEGMIHGTEAVALKQQLLKSDPSNEFKPQYQMAVIDFEAISDDGDKENIHPEQIVAPLVSYIEQYGSQDKDNIWRLQMIISQVYLDNNKLNQALQHAKSCYDSAPATVKSDVALAIKNIQLQSQQK